MSVLVKRCSSAQAPRTNRSADLRARPPPSGTSSALTNTTAANITKEEPIRSKMEVVEKPNPRASVIGAVRSLGTPSIVSPLYPLVLRHAGSAAKQGCYAPSSGHCYQSHQNLVDYHTGFASSQVEDDHLGLDCPANINGTSADKG